MGQIIPPLPRKRRAASTSIQETREASGSPEESSRLEKSEEALTFGEQLPRLSCLSEVVAIFKEGLGYEATTHLLMTFLYIASNEGCGMQELERATGATAASNSRNTDWLSYGRNAVTNNGLGLIKKERPLDQRDRRKIVLGLTSKGRELIRRLSAALDS